MIPTTIVPPNDVGHNFVVPAMVGETVYSVTGGGQQSRNGIPNSLFEEMERALGLPNFIFFLDPKYLGQ
jgi:hypothetical protein